MKIIEFFSGIGAFREGAIQANIDHKVVGISEFDKYAIQSYNSIYGETEKFGDINSIVTVPVSDIWTYGFPCQDISVAGKQEGIKEGTRSGLLLRFEKILENNIAYGETPKFLIMENVKNLIGKKHKQDFDIWLNKLEELGYKNYWKVLDAKDYEIPQNRERVFCLSIRKDIDVGFEFPEKEDLKLRLKDILEGNVDEKYYLSEKMCKKIVWNRSGTVLGHLKSYHKAYRVHDIEKYSTCLDTASGGGKTPYVIELKVKKIAQSSNEARTRGYAIGLITQNIKNDVYTIDYILNVLYKVSPKFAIKYLTKNYIIRKLTPLECWRLQGFNDESFYKAEKVCSNSQLYKQAGNSIYVGIIKRIYEKMVDYGYLKTI